MSILSLSSDTPEEGIRSLYRWLWATMWLLGIELGTSGRAVRALNHWAIAPAPSLEIIDSWLSRWEPHSFLPLVLYILTAVGRVLLPSLSSFCRKKGKGQAPSTACSQGGLCLWGWEGETTRVALSWRKTQYFIYELYGKKILKLKTEDR